MFRQLDLLGRPISGAIVSVRVANDNLMIAVLVLGPVKVHAFSFGIRRFVEF